MAGDFKLQTLKTKRRREALRPRLDIGGDGGIRTHDPGLFLRIRTRLLARKDLCGIILIFY